MLLAKTREMGNFMRSTFQLFHKNQVFAVDRSPYHIYTKKACGCSRNYGGFLSKMMKRPDTGGDRVDTLRDLW